MRVWPALIVGVLVSTPTVVWSSIWYVDSAYGLDSNDGSSWSSSLKSLQLAIDACSDGGGGEVWVAAGVYRPNSWPNGGSTSREMHFSLRTNCAVYGGFTGMESERGQRDFAVNQTILTGDLNGDDTWGNSTPLLGAGDKFTEPSGVAADFLPIRNRNENVYHVFYHPTASGLDGSEILDGFVILSGNANGTVVNPGQFAGGMLNDANPGAVRNCVFAAHYSQYLAGAVLNKGLGKVSFEYCTFVGNESVAGAGIYNYDGSSVDIINCEFKNNNGTNGKALFCKAYSTVLVSNCTFLNNNISSYSEANISVSRSSFFGQTAGISIKRGVLVHSTAIVENCSFGSGSYGIITEHDSTTIRNCTFSGGKGIYNYTGSILVEDCTFVNNSYDKGGAIYSYNGSPVIKRCTFYNNTATSYGGAIYNERCSNEKIINCTFGYNTANSGGAIFSTTFSNVLILNNTFYNNSAAAGATIYSINDTTSLIANSVIWGNPGTDLYAHMAYAGYNFVRFSVVEGGYSGAGNLSGDPQLGSLQDNGGTTQTMLPGEGSSAIGAGIFVYEDSGGNIFYYDPVSGDPLLMRDNSPITPVVPVALLNSEDQRRLARTTPIDIGSAETDGVLSLDADGDGYDALIYNGTDCDDTDASIHPGAADTWYDGIDQDCAGNSDYDQDGDGYDSADYGGGDCDDTDASIHPGAADTWYDGVDQDCAGNSDYDLDGDGYDYAAYGGTDCNDTDASIHPGSTEIWYDGVDQDCTGNSDYDQDGDGSDSADYDGGDCDDTDASIHPGSTEIWYDGVDQDCDGNSDYDHDGDGFDSAAYGGDDCNDTDTSINPGAEDTWYDDVDQDCAGNSDYDQDGDGSDSAAYGGDDCDDTDASINPGAVEICNGLDDDCDASVDEELNCSGFDESRNGSGGGCFLNVLHF